MEEYDALSKKNEMYKRRESSLKTIISFVVDYNY